MKLDHIGIAVADLTQAARFYEELGLRVTGREELPGEGVRVAFLPLDEGRIELLESVDPEGPIGRFLARRGPGLHHVSLKVSDLEAALAALAAKGYDLIDRRPRRGAGGHKVAFVHPKATGGVLLELSEES